jgi:hypothetical protein
LGVYQIGKHPNQVVSMKRQEDYFLQQGLPSAEPAHAFFTGAAPGAAIGAATADAEAAASPWPPHLCSAEAPAQAALGADTEAEAAEPSFLQQAFTSPLAAPALLHPAAAPSFLQQALVGATAVAGATCATSMAGVLLAVSAAVWA